MAFLAIFYRSEQNNCDVRKFYVPIKTMPPILNKPLNILHISTWDTKGGAGRAAYRLHRELLENGQKSLLVAKLKSCNDSTVQKFSVSSALKDRLARIFRGFMIERKQQRASSRLTDSHEPFHDDRSRFGNQITQAIPSNTDIINLHWVANDFLDYSGFFGKIKKPIVWTLHDSNPFTGGCHCPGECREYTKRCGNCPKLQSDSPRDYSHQIWQRKKQSLLKLTKNQMHIACPSSWIQKKAQESSLFQGLPTHHIPNGVDTSVFSPLATGSLGQKLAGCEKVVLFVADYTKAPWKGFVLLQQALEKLWEKRQDFGLLAIGESPKSQAPSFPANYTGRINNDPLLASIYSAATVFVIPSLEDNLPNTVLESMACGTPVVGFNTGGIPDMVRPGITGQLVEKGDVDGLAREIDSMLDNDEKRTAMSRNCRQIVEAEYSLDIQANAYSILYEKILAGN